jgi:hypothetical protein
MLRKRRQDDCEQRNACHYYHLFHIDIIIDKLFNTITMPDKSLAHGPAGGVKTM